MRKRTGVGVIIGSTKHASKRMHSPDVNQGIGGMFCRLIDIVYKKGWDWIVAKTACFTNCKRNLGQEDCISKERWMV